jgi:hypothetical protein
MQKNMIEGDENEMDLASRAVFCEVLLLTVTSHGIHSMFLALGTDVPPLPSWGDMRMAPPPSNVRFSSLLYRVRRDDNQAHAPYFWKKDLNKNSPEYSKIGEGIWKQMLDLPIPDMCTKFSPRDNVTLQAMTGCAYLSLPGEMLLDWNNLDPSKHCSSVTRFDVETVAGAVATEHECDY